MQARVLSGMTYVSGVGRQDDSDILTRRNEGLRPCVLAIVGGGAGHRPSAPKTAATGNHLDRGPAFAR